jgi:hypothetical protein
MNLQDQQWSRSRFVHCADPEPRHPTAREGKRAAFMNRRDVISATCAALAALHRGAVAADGRVNASRCLEVVRRYADAMIEQGRDVYGAVQSPLFASTLSRKTLRLPEKPPGDISGIVRGRWNWSARKDGANRGVERLA